MVKMRVTRAYLAGFGTTGSLLAGVAVLFVAASAVVSFHGWPSFGLPAQPAALVRLRDPASTPAPSATLRRLIAAARRVSAGVPARSRTSRAGGRGRAGRSAVLARTGRAQHQSSSSGGHGGSGGHQGSGGHGQKPPGSGPVTPPNPAGSLLGNTVKAVTGGVATTLGSTGSALGSTTSSLTGALGKILSNVSPALGSTVSGAGKALSSTVSGTTSGLGGAVGAIGQKLGSGLGGL
jgi:hypothetical protein